MGPLPCRPYGRTGRTRSFAVGTSGRTRTDRTGPYGDRTKRTAGLNPHVVPFRTCRTERTAGRLDAGVFNRLPLVDRPPEDRAENGTFVPAHPTVTVPHLIRLPEPLPLPYPFFLFSSKQTTKAKGRKRVRGE